MYIDGSKRKVKNRCYRKRQNDREAFLEVRGVEGDHEGIENGEDQSLEKSLDLIKALELRKLRRQAHGLTVSDLSMASSSKEKKTTEKRDRLVSLDDVKEGRFGTSNSAFATGSNMMDSERLMEKYVDKEFRKRRGEELIQSKDNPTTSGLSSEPNLVAMIVKESMNKRTVERAIPKVPSGVNISSAMLTVIPEVDLGIEPKLRNIEDTEVAKKKLLEQKRSSKGNSNDEWSPRAGMKFKDGLDTIKFWTGHRFGSSRSDKERFKSNNHNTYMNVNKSDGKFPNRPYSNRNRMATDDFAVEQFKKRIRRA